jgi:hypothetical protein
MQCGFRVVCVLAGLASTPRAQASDPSTFVTEILTPAGWELSGRWCGAQDEPVTSAELRTPEGWGNKSTREEPRWGGVGCSEVVVPLEWTRAAASGRSSRRR